MGIKMTIGILVIVVALIGIIAYLLNDIPTLIRQSPAQRNVLVEGVVKTGFGAYPHSINFTSYSTHQTASATIDKNGYYSIILLGNETYNVTAYYGTLFGISTNRNCMGVLTINGTANAINFSRSC